MSYYRARPTFVGPAFRQGDRLVKKANDFQFNLQVSPNNSYNIVDTAGEDPGELQGFRITTNLPDLIMRVIVYGDSPTPDVINNFTMSQLLSRGAGLTPGDAETTSNGHSKDPTGQQNGLYPWIARYKDDLLPDYLGYEDRVIVLMYTPTIYDRYSRIVVDLVNTNDSASALVQDILVKRLVYQEITDNSTPPKIGNRGEFSNTVTEVKEQSNMDYDVDPTPQQTPVLYDTID